MGAIFIQTTTLSKLTSTFNNQSFMLMILKGQKLSLVTVFRGMGYVEMIRLGHYGETSMTEYE